MKSKLQKGLGITAMLASGILFGCANTAYDTRFSWKDGWRQGLVTAIGEGAVFSDKLTRTCRQTDLSQQQSTRYLTIMYKPVTGRIWITVPAPANASFKPNDSVYVNVVDCSKRVEHSSS